MKLALSQEKALARLSATWQTPYALRVGIRTLDSLVRMGLAERRALSGDVFPRVNTEYRIAERQEKDP